MFICALFIKRYQIEEASDSLDLGIFSPLPEAQTRKQVTADKNCEYIIQYIGCQIVFYSMHELNQYQS